MSSPSEVERDPERLDLLLIEDDAAVAEMYRMTLEQDGYTVRVASDGPSGLALAEQTAPDLIFLDVRLPGMDGFSVLERMRLSASTRFTPVVILSAYGESELRERGVRLGALEYVIKSQTTPGQISGRVPAWTSAPSPE
ncbi:MAG TPA: response regulator [Candidatus Nitrosotalea sp.]|nr:response regulator [Candidatus Nitrosotalea sp.]